MKLRAEVMRWIDDLWEDAGPDRGWSWVILAATFVFSIGTYGVISSGGSGVIYVEMILVYGVTRKEAMWPFGIVGVTQCVSGLLSGFIVHYLDIRKMFVCASILTSLACVLCFWANGVMWIAVCFGALFGTGLGMSINYCPFLLSQYFRKYEATATGVFLSSIPVSGFLLAPLLNYLMGVYGLRGTLLLLGGVITHLIIASALLRPRTRVHFRCLREDPESPEQTKVNGSAPPQGTPSKLVKSLKMYKSVLSEPILYVISTQAAVGFNTLVGVAVTLPDFLMDVGYDRQRVIVVIIVLSAGALVGRLACGVFFDRGWATLKTISIFSLFGMAVGLFAMRLTPSGMAGLVVAILTLSISEGLTHTLISVLCRHYIGQEQLPASLAIRLFVTGMSSFLRPIIVGFFRDGLGTYVYFYDFLAVSAALTGFAWFFEHWMVGSKDAVPSTDPAAQELVKKLPHKEDRDQITVLPCPHKL